MNVFSGSVFVMNVDGKATFAFEAKNFPEAFELCKEDWVREDLITMTSNGVPLCSSTAGERISRTDRNRSMSDVFDDQAAAAGAPTASWSSAETASTTQAE